MKIQKLLSLLTITSLLAANISYMAQADDTNRMTPAPGETTTNAPTQPGGSPAPGSQPQAEEAERVNVDKIKEKYWARGDESELGVVQNRLYSKSEKLEFGIYGGIIGTDPFLSVKSLGASLGFHFSEYFSIHALAWRDFVNPSSALDYLRNGSLHTEANINQPISFVGLEGAASLLYGKLSLIGKSIIYYDLHFTGGAGSTATETGAYLTPFLGIGQQIYISKIMSLSVDYRIMRYNEKIVERVIPTKLGQYLDNRINYNNSVTLGLTFLFGVGL